MCTKPFSIPIILRRRKPKSKEKIKEDFTPRNNGAKTRIVLIPGSYYVKQTPMNLGFETLRWIGGCDGMLELIDQRLLPQRMEYLRCEDPQTLFEAIVTLAVRGAPAIGVAAAYGICLGLRQLPGDAPLRQALEDVEKTAGYLAASRPTAVNLFWALERMKKTAARFAADKPAAEAGILRQILLNEARVIENEDKEMCLAIGRNGQSLIPDGKAILTHCNAGALATAGIGTALAPMYLAHQQGKKFTVYVDETRPLLQGARLTAWELTRAGISAVLICDNMAAGLMKAGKIAAVFVGADRIAANGDTANKIGTLGLSILCRRFSVPFYVAAPSSTFDLSIPDGSHIPIEQRKGDEVRGFAGQTTSPENIAVYNPAFDVTDAGDITAIITERGIIPSPGGDNIRRGL
jgi:methylthioribose-1-phosphate isomerase